MGCMISEMGFPGQGIAECLGRMGMRTGMEEATKNSHFPSHHDADDSGNNQDIFPGFGIDKCQLICPLCGAQALAPSVLQLTISRAPMQ